MSAIPAYIYGLFDGERCEYVGVTVDPYQREWGHKKGLLKENPHWQFKIIETLTRSTVGDAERRWITHYKSIGQAGRNIKQGFRKSAKPHEGKAGRRVTCSNGMTFPSRVEMARYIRMSDTTARKILKLDGGRHNKLIFAYAD